MYNRAEIKQALLQGNEKGYKLFPEVSDKSELRNLTSIVQGKMMIEQIKVYAETAVEEASPDITFIMYKEFERTGNRIIFENAYFKRRKQLFSLVITYIIEKDKKYIPLIEEKLWQWCDVYSWELPAHFSMSADSIKKSDKGPDAVVALFAAEMGFFLAEIVSIIGNELDEFLVYRIKNEIFRRVIDPYKSSSYWWENAKMNWSSVCSGSVGAAAIYLIEDIDELALILERVLKSMEVFIDAFDKDGLIEEGLSYWSYGFSFYVYFSELLRERTAGQTSILQGNVKIKKIAQLPQIMQFPSGDFVNFSDAGSGKWFGDCGLFSRLDKILNIKGYNYENSYDLFRDNTFRWAVMSRNLFWCNNLGNSDEEIKAGSFYFSESQWLVDRRKNDNGAFVAFAAKGGNNDEPHNHNDLGNFILHYKGENIFIDIGSPEYVKGYFNNDTRYNYLAASSLGHSVPVINDNAQSYGKDYYAKVIEYKEIDSKTYFTLDLKNAYPCSELTQYERKFIWDFEKLGLLIKDKFRFNKLNNNIKEAFITKVKPEIISEGKLRINVNKSIAELEFPLELQCIIEECTYNDHEGKISTIYRTLFSDKIGEEKEYIFNFRFIS